MKTLLTLTYVASGLYSLALFAAAMSYIWENKRVVGVSKVGLINRYSTIILWICLIATPIQLYFSIASRIPETTYTINGTLEVNGDDNVYSVPIKVEYFIDIDYEEDEKHDYLFDGGTLKFARSISLQDKDPTAVTPPGRSLSPAMRGFFKVAQTQSVLRFFNFTAVGNLRNRLFPMGSAGSNRNPERSGRHDGKCALRSGIRAKRGMATENRQPSLAV